MSGAGRAAALPQPGYQLPQRLHLDDGQCRVRFFPERGGPPADIDLSVLPVARGLQEWLAVAVAGATGPSGPRRTTTSALGTLSILKRFTKHLAGLARPPQRPGELKAVHLDGFILASHGGTLHRDIGSLRSILRFAPDPPAEFWARLNQARADRTDGRVRSYTEAEFRRITAKARTDLRAAAARIRAGRQLLAAWRAGEIDPAADRYGWEEGQLLDHVDRHGDVPRGGRDGQQPTLEVGRHGGPPKLIARLHATHADVGAAAVLLICLTGHNASTLATVTADHMRPDGHAGGPPTAIVELLKPRRGSRHAHMSVPWQDTPPEPTPPGQPRDDLSTPFGVYTLVLELAASARARLGTNDLFVYYCDKGKAPRGFRLGLPKSLLLQLWGAKAGLVCDPPEGEPQQAEAPEPLHIDGRRLRMTWLELHQRPVAQTEQTLANEYLARNRGNLATYQKVVAEVLDEQVARARARPPITMLTAEDITEAATDPAAVAARHGMDVATLEQLLAGQLDTVLAGCADHTNSPHSPPGQPCTASFLLCLSCPCARATPAHLPVQVLVGDVLEARREQMTPLRWANQYAEPATRLHDLLDHHSPAAVADARAMATDADRALVDRFLTRGLDLT